MAINHAITVTSLFLIGVMLAFPAQSAQLEVVSRETLEDTNSPRWKPTCNARLLGDITQGDLFRLQSSLETSMAHDVLKLCSPCA